jgi:hypothetical protein
MMFNKQTWSRRLALVVAAVMLCGVMPAGIFAVAFGAQENAPTMMTSVEYVFSVEDGITLNGVTAQLESGGVVNFDGVSVAGGRAVLPLDGQSLAGFENLGYVTAPEGLSVVLTAVIVNGVYELAADLALVQAAGTYDDATYDIQDGIDDDEPYVLGAVYGYAVLPIEFTNLNDGAKVAACYYGNAWLAYTGGLFIFYVAETETKNDSVVFAQTAYNPPPFGVIFSLQDYLTARAAELPVGTNLAMTDTGGVPVAGSQHRSAFLFPSRRANITAANGNFPANQNTGFQVTEVTVASTGGANRHLTVTRDGGSNVAEVSGVVLRVDGGFKRNDRIRVSGVATTPGFNAQLREHGVASAGTSPANLPTNFLVQVDVDPTTGAFSFDHILTADLTDSNRGIVIVGTTERGSGPPTISSHSFRVDTLTVTRPEPNADRVNADPNEQPPYVVFVGPNSQTNATAILPLNITGIAAAAAVHVPTGWFFSNTGATPSTLGSGSQGSGLRVVPSTFLCQRGVGRHMLEMQLSSSSVRAYNLALEEPILANTGRFGIAFDYFYTGVQGAGADGQSDPLTATFVLGLSNTPINNRSAGTVGSATNPINGHLHIFSHRVSMVPNNAGNVVTDGLTPGWNTVYGLIDSALPNNNVRWFAAPTRTAPSFEAFANMSSGFNTGTWNSANPINSISFMTTGGSSATVLNLKRLHVFEYLNNASNNFLGPDAPFVPCGDCADCIPPTGWAGQLRALDGTTSVNVSVGGYRNILPPAILPVGAGQMVTWHSNNEAVATVGNNRINGVGVGSTTIYARSVFQTTAGQHLTSNTVTVNVSVDTRVSLAEWDFTIANYPTMPIGQSNVGVTVVPASGGAQGANAGVRGDLEVLNGTTPVPAGTAVLRRVFDTALGNPGGSSGAVRQLIFGTDANMPGGWLHAFAWTRADAWVQLEFSTVGQTRLGLSYDISRFVTESPPAVVVLSYSIDNGPWVTVDSIPTAMNSRMHFLPSALDNRQNVRIRWHGVSGSQSGSVSFRNIRLFSGADAPPACCPNPHAAPPIPYTNDCEVCRPIAGLAIFPFPLAVRTEQSRADGQLLGWGQGSFGSCERTGLARGAANVRYMVFEFNSDPGQWQIAFQNDSWQEHTILYPTLRSGRTILPDGTIRYVVDFSSDLPARAGNRAYDASALFGTFQIAFGNPDPASGTWYDFRDKIKTAYITNIRPTRHPEITEVNVETWASFAAHTPNNILTADASGRAGLKLHYTFSGNTAGIPGVRLQYSIDGGTNWRNIESAFSIINTPGASVSNVTRMEVLPTETYNQPNLAFRWIPHGPWGDSPWGSNTFNLTNIRLTRGLQVSEFARRTSPVSGITSLMGQNNPNVNLVAGGNTQVVEIPTVTSTGDSTTAWSSSRATIVNLSNLTATQATVRSFGTAGTSVIRVAATADSSVYTEFTATVTPGIIDPTIQYKITSPYAGVNWNSFNQFKAAHHTHSTHSDGHATVAELAEMHYALGFHIVANTDHDRRGTTPNQRPLAANGNPEGDSDPDALMTLQRIQQMADGVGRGGGSSDGMVFIPGGNEHSGLVFEELAVRPTGHHVNGFFSFIPRQGNNVTVQSVVARVDGSAATPADREGRGGLLRVNHPGRYTGSQHPTHWDIAEAIARNPAMFLPYAALFRSSHSLIGMEIINKFDTESQADRILWDHILSINMARPIPMPIWGFSDDDSHNNANIGFSYNLLLMPELSLSEVHNAMNTGAFFAFTRQERQYGIFPRPMRPYFWPGDNGVDGRTSQPALELPKPRINSITTGTNSITINAAMVQSNNAAPYSGTYNFDACIVSCESICLVHPAFIHWYADGIRIDKGSTLDLVQHQLSIGSYVRASVGHRSYGVLYTQPFEVQITRANSAPVAARTLPNLVDFVKVPAPNLNGVTRYQLETEILPAAVRINTTASDNTTHPRFATVIWDLSRYSQTAPDISQIVGRVMLPAGIKEVTNTNNIDLYSVFTGVGCNHNNWGVWTAVPGEAATCNTSGRESRECQEATCNEVQFRSVASLGHDWGNFTEGYPTAEYQTRTCNRPNCGAAQTFRMPPVPSVCGTCGNEDCDCPEPVERDVPITSVEYVVTVSGASENEPAFRFQMREDNAPDWRWINRNIPATNGVHRIDVPPFTPAADGFLNMGQVRFSEGSTATLTFDKIIINNEYELEFIEPMVIQPGNEAEKFFDEHLPGDISIKQLPSRWQAFEVATVPNGLATSIPDGMVVATCADGGDAVLIFDMDKGSAATVGDDLVAGIIVLRVTTLGGGGDDCKICYPRACCRICNTHPCSCRPLPLPQLPPIGGGGFLGAPIPGLSHTPIEGSGPPATVNAGEGINVTVPPTLRNVHVDVTKSEPGEITSGSDSTVFTVNVGFSSGNTTLARVAQSIRISVSMDNVDLAGVNTHRLVAFNGSQTIIGGYYNAAANAFVFETAVAGTFEIKYVENLRRLNLTLGSTTITDLAANAAPQNMSVPPVIESGRTLIPVRYLSYSLGTTVDWNEASREVSLSANGRTLVFRLDSTSPELVMLGMDVPPIVIDGRTMVPLRFISEFFGAVVNWSDSTRTVEVIYN